jgi:hypothetical protein
MLIRGKIILLLFKIVVYCNSFNWQLKNNIMLSNLTVIRPTKASSKWSMDDFLGSAKVRLSFGRDNYKVKPGLYALNDPTKVSEVFVTANYKLSFDIVRRELDGISAWILVLDTYGVNVWCAAGKGTFGSNELIRQIQNSGLHHLVEHRRLIVPQLGAPGINAQKVKQESGFNVKFGPVRATDIKAYLNLGLKKTEEMSTVKFNFVDRLKLAPVELMTSLSKFIIVALFFFLISGISSKGYSWSMSVDYGLKITFILLVAYIGGTIITPLLLPWLPFRSFAGKGIVVGSILLLISGLFLYTTISISGLISILLIGISITSFLAMNFTGASTFTSLSGVYNEMRMFVPIQITSASVGLILFVVSRFINF